MSDYFQCSALTESQCTTESLCQWDNSGTCSINPATQNIAEFVLPMLTSCTQHTDQPSCGKAKQCLWSEKHTDCQNMMEPLLNHNLCRSKSNETVCSLNLGCSWEEGNCNNANLMEKPSTAAWVQSVSRDLNPYLGAVRAQYENECGSGGCPNVNTVLGIPNWVAPSGSRLEQTLQHVLSTLHLDDDNVFDVIQCLKPVEDGGMTLDCSCVDDSVQSPQVPSFTLELDSFKLGITSSQATKHCQAVGQKAQEIWNTASQHMQVQDKTEALQTAIKYNANHASLDTKSIAEWRSSLAVLYGIVTTGNQALQDMQTTSRPAPNL